MLKKAGGGNDVTNLIGQKQYLPDSSHLLFCGEVFGFNFLGVHYIPSDQKRASRPMGIYTMSSWQTRTAEQHAHDVQGMSVSASSATNGPGTQPAW